MDLPNAEIEDWWWLKILDLSTSTSEVISILDLLTSTSEEWKYQEQQKQIENNYAGW